MHTKISKQSTFLLSSLTLAIYAILISLSPHRLIYDEGYYNLIARESLKHASPLSPEFIEGLTAPTGILYSIVHQLFAPLTHLDVPGARFPNLIFLAATFVILLRWIRLGENASGVQAPGRFTSSLMLLAFPTTGFITCLALTENSSILLATGACCLLQDAYYLSTKDADTSPTLIKPIFYYAAAGLLLGLSTLGRQNFIVLVFAAIPYFLSLRKSFRLPCGTAFLLPIAAIFVYPIVVWHGLVPPAVAYVEKGIRISSLIQTLGYTGIFAFVCFPNLLRFKIVPTSFLLPVAVVLSPLSLDQIRLGPLRSPVEKIAGSFGLQLIQMTLAFVLTFSALLISINLLKLLKRCIHDQNLRPDLIFCILAIILISLSNIKIAHQFSIRYITLMIPMLAYISSFISANQTLFIPRYMVGSVLSSLPVLTYFGAGF